MRSRGEKCTLQILDVAELVSNMQILALGQHLWSQLLNPMGGRFWCYSGAAYLAYLEPLDASGI